MCSCFGILQQIRSIRRSVLHSILATLISSFIMSKLDYCNAALAGLPRCNIDRLQSVINAAARVTVGAQRTPLLAELHWLRMPLPQCIQYKLCVLVNQCVHRPAPFYLNNTMHLHCSFTVTRRLIFELTRLILDHFVRMGTALSSQSTCSGWPRPRTATAHIRLISD